MNKELSSKLLQEVMNWGLEDANRYLQEIQFMANMKYDGYDLYMPGNRFVASLIQWLDWFDESERQELFNFIMDELVFISSTQMSYLVDLLYNTLIKETFKNQTAIILGCPPYKIKNIEKTATFKDAKRKALIMGLSDGAHTDILRRSAGFSNEQVLTFYYPSEDKIKDMRKKLAREVPEENARFTSLYLIDDFAASGISFIRYDKEEKRFKGKLTEILGQFEKHANEDKVTKMSIKNLMIGDGQINVYVCFCLATEYAVEYMKNLIQQYLVGHELISRFKVEFLVVQRLNDSMKISVGKHPKLVEIISNKKNFLFDDVVTDSYKKGKCDNPYLGFNECALPLVLSHNTPNNSLPILWQYSSEVDGFHGIFPRINRH